MKFFGLRDQVYFLWFFSCVINFIALHPFPWIWNEKLCLWLSSRCPKYRYSTHKSNFTMNEISINRVLRILVTSFDLGEYLLHLNDTSVIISGCEPGLRQPNTRGMTDMLTCWMLSLRGGKRRYNDGRKIGGTSSGSGGWPGIVHFGAFGCRDVDEAWSSRLHIRLFNLII